MTTKRVLLLGLALITMIAANAQDLIVKQDGESIKAYRTDVGSNAVYYRLEDNDQAPILMIDKKEVLIIKLQDGTKISMDEAVSNTNVGTSTGNVPKYPTEPVADPEMIAHAEIGSLIEFYDGTKGIVFYLDGNGHGLAVSLDQTYDICWQKAKWYECVDIDGIPNMREGNYSIEMEMGLGAVYCDAAIKQVGLEALPAIKWCRSIGPDWYLPSLGELYQLMVVANQSSLWGTINNAIKQAGGTSLGLGLKYYFEFFSSSEEDNTNVYTIVPNGKIVVKKKYNPCACRPIRMF